ncbi:MAG: hypothetical protein L6R42_010343, partial [Xanthoria sp. 1 TBL-2021]
LSLEETLSSFKTFGSFAISGKVPGDVSTGLSIPGIRRIAFPPIIDENGRETWELNPDDFELLNPAWPTIVPGLLDTVSKELGDNPDVSIGVNLYKLLLYEEGHTSGLIKTLRRSRKVRTLVICLPSEYEGGYVDTSHCEKTKFLALAQAFITPTSAASIELWEEASTEEDSHTWCGCYNDADDFDKDD